MDMLDDGHDENSKEDLEKVICEIVLQQLKWKESISNVIDLDLGVFQELEALVQSCSVKKMSLKISQNSRENTCAKASFLIKLQGSAILLKKRLWHRCFPVNFVKSLRTLISIEHLWWMLLKNVLMLLQVV